RAYPIWCGWRWWPEFSTRRDGQPLSWRAQASRRWSWGRLRRGASAPSDRPVPPTPGPGGARPPYDRVPWPLPPCADTAWRLPAARPGSAYSPPSRVRNTTHKTHFRLEDNLGGLTKISDHVVRRIRPESPPAGTRKRADPQAEPRISSIPCRDLARYG